MEIIDLLSSVSRVAVIAFFLTVVAILIELFLINRQSHRKDDLDIPDFKPEQIKIDPALNATPLRPEIISKLERKHFTFKGNPQQIKIMLILFILMLLFGLLFASYYVAVKFKLFNLGQEKETTVSQQQLSSSGIEVYDANWQRLSAAEFKQLEPGDIIFIGIKTIKNSDIEAARIRINENKWNTDEEVNEFNSQINVYYRQYLLGVYDSRLLVEAELKSTEQGWLYSGSQSIGGRYQYERKTYRKIINIRETSETQPTPTVMITPFISEITPEISISSLISPTTTSGQKTTSVTPTVTSKITSSAISPSAMPISTSIISPTGLQTTPPASGFLKPSIIILIIVVIFVVVGFAL